MLQLPLLIYITIYILINYIYYIRGYCILFFKTEITEIEITEMPSLYHSLFFSKASHHEEFFGSLAAEVLKGVILRVLWQAEVRQEAAVGPARHVKAVALIDKRIAFASFPLRSILDEGEVVSAVSREHACVILSHFSSAVACQDSF